MTVKVQCPFDHNMFNGVNVGCEYTSEFKSQVTLLEGFPMNTVDPRVICLNCMIVPQKVRRFWFITKMFPFQFFFFFEWYAHSLP